MQDFIGVSIETVRMTFFIGIFAVMAGLEFLLPRRKRQFGRVRRWPTNWAIVLLDALLVRLIFPIGGVGLCIWAEANGIGLFNHFGASGWLPAVAGFLLLDFAVWLQHLAAHKIPLLWRLHRVHHADGDMDVTTALRFHPIEILLSFMWKAGVAIAVGVPPEAMLIFEIVLNGAAIFNHANARLPLALDRILRLIVVTPDMHRVHHSDRQIETDSNYGFNLSVWDRLFKTYTAQPQGGHDGMTVGLTPDLAERATHFPASLAIPFVNVQDRRTADED